METKKIMTHEEFIALVKEMRYNQKMYFKYRKKEFLTRSQNLETRVDNEIENYEEETLF